MPKTKLFDREKALEITAAIFKKNGYNGTSVDEILVATGLSRSSLYETFKDKHNLYLQALEFYKNHEAQQLNSIQKRELNGLEKIECVFKETVNKLLKLPSDNGCLMVNAATEMCVSCDDTSHIISESKKKMEDTFAEWLSQARKEGVIKLSKPPKAYGTFLYNALCGLKVMSQGGADKTELNNAVKITLQALN